MEPLEYLRVLRRRWPVVALGFLLAAAMAVITTPRRPVPTGPPTRTFTATHTLIRDTAVAAEQQIGLDLLALFATTGVIPPRVAERLGLDTEPALLATRVTVQADAKLGTLAITSRDADGDQAALLANTFAEEILAYVTEQAEKAREQAVAATSGRLSQQQARIRELDRRLGGLPADSIDAELIDAERDALLEQYRIGVQRVEQLNSLPANAGGLYTLQAAVPVPSLDAGFQPPTSRRGRVGTGGALGLALGLALAFGLERIDTRVRTRRGAEHAFGLPVVAEVAKVGRRVRRQRAIVVTALPASFASEAYRMLRLALQIMPRWVLPSSAPTPSPAQPDAPLARDAARRLGDGPAKAILVTSPGPREGKTSTVANLAASFAEIGKAVLVLDCDFRHPELHTFLGVAQGPGVSNYLMQRDAHGSLAALVQETQLPGVRIVTSGTAVTNPGELVGPEQDLLTSATELADVVIVDAGPVLAVNDPAALVPRVDAVVVVAHSGRTTAEAAHRTTEYLSRLGAPVLGVALIGVARPALGRRYYDGYAIKTADLTRPGSARELPVAGREQDEPWWKP